MDSFHKHRQVRLAGSRHGLNSGLAFGSHPGMVAAMSSPRSASCLAVVVIALFSMAAVAQPTAQSVARPAAQANVIVSPDFDELTELIAASVQGNGPAPQAGDRTELYRYTPTGWEVQMFAVWSGYRWLLLAAHVHHPARESDSRNFGQGQWETRYAELLKSYSPDWVERLTLPDLFEVPPPDYNPAVPDEVRSRRFVWQDYWYEARWFNSGGVDDDAEWSLLSYDLVAQEPPEPESESESD